MRKKFGHLDNLSLGMGLTAKPGQVISVERASLEGIENKKSFGLFWLLLVGIIIYKIL